MNNNFSRKEFIEICKKFNSGAAVREVVIEYSSSSYFNKVKKAVETDRRGEVAFCVVRPDGRLITVTCEEYPSGTFRVPTGGIGYNEDIVNAVYRETKEELGLKAEITDFAGVIKIRFVHNSCHVMFYSYLFILREISGNLLKDAADNEVSEVREVSVDELEAVALSLKNLSGKWSDWGRFRYETTNAIYRYLKSGSII